MYVSLKLLYEFWVYCINSPNSTLTGLSGSAYYTRNLPSGFENGNVITNGVDGITSYDTPGRFYSNSASWNTATHLGKYLVFWRPGEETPDDSIYKIINVVDQETIEVDNFMGGGTVGRGNVPKFLDRTDIYFRVVDIESVRSLTFGVSPLPGMILTFSGSSEINSNQRNSQVEVLLTSTHRAFQMRISPSGSWNGSSFSDASSTISTAEYFSTTSAPRFFYLAGSKDHLIYKGAESPLFSNVAIFHIEIPQRLYPENVDPNPVAVMNQGDAGYGDFNSFSSGADYETHRTYGYNFYMFSPNHSATRSYVSLGRLLWNGAADFVEQSNSVSYLYQSGSTPSRAFSEPTVANQSNHRYHDYEYNKFSNLVFSSDLILYLNDRTYGSNSREFTFGRVRLRKARATHANQPKGVRHGLNWIHNGRGVLFPWDNCVIPFSPFWRDDSIL